MGKYRSPYEAYTFLCEDSTDLRCDFELLTDEIASLTGVLHGLLEQEELKAELVKVCELIYHLNPTLRTTLTITDEEIQYLINITLRLKEETAHRMGLFVLPLGNVASSTAHVLRSKSKAVVRLIYKYLEFGGSVDNKVIDVANIFSGYFFYLAVKINSLYDIDEIPYTSRNYKIEL